MVASVLCPLIKRSANPYCSSAVVMEMAFQPSTNGGEARAGSVSRERTIPGRVAYLQRGNTKKTRYQKKIPGPLVGPQGFEP